MKNNGFFIHKNKKNCWEFEGRIKAVFPTLNNNIFFSTQLYKEGNLWLYYSKSEF